MIPEEILHKLPAFHASLNALVTVLISAGMVFIKRKNVTAHKTCMLVAAAASAVFLTSYVIYHANVGSVPFTHPGFVRYVYYIILIPHVILAAVTLPLILTTLYRAYKNDLEGHKRIAKWTFPLWLYVAVTGVLVYLMLYVWFPGTA